MGAFIMGNAPIEGLFWPDIRAEDLRRQFETLSGKGSIRYSFSPAMKTDIRYFPDDITDELQGISAPRFLHVDIDGEEGNRPNVVILSCHGSDMAPRLWQLRERLPERAIVVGWLWDNHTGAANNLRTALACDIVYPSHWYCSGYLNTPATLVGGHVPSCSAQWTGQAADRLMTSLGYGSRRNSVLANYVDYLESPRSEVLARVGREVPEVELLLMQRENRSRYFSMSIEQRFAEWTAYKATLILPVSHDLSTRLFDALLTGMVPIVPHDIVDFDTVVSQEIQQELGIVRLRSYESDAIGEASREALDVFDSMGVDGVRARHRYARENHMLGHRVALILDDLIRLASGEVSIEFSDGPFGPALYQTAQP